MAGVILADAMRLSEFYVDPRSGKFMNGTCGETALTVALGCVQQRPAQLGDLERITNDMLAQGLASANGASTVTALAAEARRQGAVVRVEADYAEPLTFDWHATLLAYAGYAPVILEVAAAHNLRDVETGAADEAQVDYHYIVIIGRQSDGYVANDGDQLASNVTWRVYSYADLASAVPCGLLVIDRPAAPPPAKGAAMTIEEFVAANPVLGAIIRAPYPVAGKTGVLDGTQEAVCQNGKVLAFPDGSIVGGICGTQLLAAEAEVTTLTAQVQDLAAKLAAAPAAATPVDEAATAAIAALKHALGLS